MVNNYFYNNIIMCILTHVANIPKRVITIFFPKSTYTSYMLYYIVFSMKSLSSRLYTKNIK